MTLENSDFPSSSENRLKIDEPVWYLTISEPLSLKNRVQIDAAAWYLTIYDKQAVSVIISHTLCLAVPHHSNNHTLCLAVPAIISRSVNSNSHKVTSWCHRKHRRLGLSCSGNSTIVDKRGPWMWSRGPLPQGRFIDSEEFQTRRRPFNALWWGRTPC